MFAFSLIMPFVTSILGAFHGYFFMRTIINCLSILCSKRLLKCVVSQFDIERVVSMGQHDRKS